MKIFNARFWHELARMPATLEAEVTDTHRDLVHARDLPIAARGLRRFTGMGFTSAIWSFIQISVIPRS